jgi:hypothetical protein
VKKTRKDLVNEALRASRRHLLKEEGEEAPAPKPQEEGGDSLDNQVDKYLAQYEGEAKTAKVEGLDFRALTRRLLTEEGEDEPGEDPGTAEKLGLDDLNVESFADSVVRLIDNYDSLLEVRNTLLRRAKGFLKKTYNDDVLEAYDRLMREEHGVEDGKSPGEVSAEEFPAPQADRSGAGDVGGTTGGGGAA